MIGMKRVGILLVIGALAGPLVVQGGASAAPVAGAAKKCKKQHGAKRKHRKCKKRSGGSTQQPPVPTSPASGSGPLSISPTSWNFGAFPIGLFAIPQQFTVTNNSSDPTGTLATSIAGISPANFQTAGDGCAGSALGGGAHCSLFVGCNSSGILPATFNASLVVSGNPGGTREAAMTCTQF